MGEYGREKMHVNHFWELKGYRIFFPFFDWLLWLLVIWLWFYNTQSYSFYFLRFNVIFLVIKLLIKVNEIKVKKGVELAQHLVEFYYAQVKWVFFIKNATKSSLIMTDNSANWRMICMEVNFLLVVICLYSYFQLGSQVLESMKGYLEELVVELQQVHLNMTGILEVFVPLDLVNHSSFQLIYISGRSRPWEGRQFFVACPVGFSFSAILFFFLTKIREDPGPRSATVYFQVN